LLSDFSDGILGCHTILLPDELKVIFLIDRISGCWDEDLVRACFSAADSDLVLKIALNMNRIQDFVSWLHTKSGIYTVKSAYLMARTESFYLCESVNWRGTTSNQTRLAKEWKQPWAIKAPPKMKIVLWSLAHNCLPTGQQLKRRHAPAPEFCYCCGREETLEHTFLTCPHVVEIWRELKEEYGLTRHLKKFSSMKRWLFDLLMKSSQEEATILTVTLWQYLGS
jgi:hypothetical protein